MSKPIVHLCTGMVVCGKLRTYCHADPTLDATGTVATDATEQRAKATCAECCSLYDAHMREWEALHGEKL